MHTEFDSEEEQEVKSILEGFTNAETMDLAQSVNGRNIQLNSTELQTHQLAKAFEEEIKTFFSELIPCLFLLSV